MSRITHRIGSVTHYDCGCTAEPGAAPDPSTYIWFCAGHDAVPELRALLDRVQRYCPVPVQDRIRALLRKSAAPMPPSPPT